MESYFSKFINLVCNNFSINDFLLSIPIVYFITNYSTISSILPSDNSTISLNLIPKTTCGCPAAA